MSGLNNLQKRLSYRGGAKQQARMIQDKARAMAGALNYSYQSEIIKLADGRQFACLINPNKISMELDDKMLSLDFEGERVDKPGTIEKIQIRPGDTLTWVHPDGEETHWLVYLKYLQEKAYFRGLMRQCSTAIEIDGTTFWVYLKGPDEKTINWSKTKQNIFNSLNYTLEMYISNTQITNEFFERFKICKIQGKNWEVQGVDRITTEGVLCVYLKEHYTNIYEKEPETPSPTPVDPTVPHISGPTVVYPFDIITYSIIGDNGGTWTLSNDKARIMASTNTSATIEITTGRSGDVDLIYNDDIILNIQIMSL